MLGNYIEKVCNNTAGALTIFAIEFTSKPIAYWWCCILHDQAEKAFGTQSQSQYASF